MSKNHAPSYHLHSSRVSTFLWTRKGSAANQALNWPHNKTNKGKAISVENDRVARLLKSLTPQELSLAGFYHLPNTEHNDSTKCFLCGLIVDSWTEVIKNHVAIANEGGKESHESHDEDNDVDERINPLDIHHALNPNCGWVVIRLISWESDGQLGGAAISTGSTTVWSTKTQQPGLKRKNDWIKSWGPDYVNFPRGDRLKMARRMTFEKGWPHEGANGIATKEEIADAGWYFRPGEEDDEQDYCVCPYCLRTVGGWEEGDDPVALHNRKIGLKCPFFLAPEPPSISEITTTTTTTTANTHKPTLPRSKGRVKLSLVSESAVDEFPTEAEELNVEVEDEEQVKEQEDEEREPETMSRGVSSNTKTIKSKKATTTTAAAAAAANSTVPVKVSDLAARKTSSRRGAKQSKPVSDDEDKEEAQEENDNAEGRVADFDSVGPHQVEDAKELASETAVVVAVPTKGKKGKAAPSKGKVAQTQKGRASKKSTAVVEVGHHGTDADDEEVVSVAMEHTKEPEVPRAPEDTKIEEAPPPNSKKGRGKVAATAKTSVSTVAPVIAEVDSLPAASEKSGALQEESNESGSATSIEVKNKLPPKRKGKSKKHEASAAESSLLAAMEDVVIESATQTSAMQPLSNGNVGHERIPLSPIVAVAVGVAIVSPSSQQPKSSLQNSKSIPPLTTQNVDTGLERIKAPSPMLYKPKPNPFTQDIPSATSEERKLTIEQWYDLCGRRAYEAVENEMNLEKHAFEERVDETRLWLNTMIEAAEVRETRQAASRKAIRSAR